MNFLDKIIEHKRLEVAQRKERISIEQLKGFMYYTMPCRSLKSYILRPDKSGIIAEYKRRSPSQGAINEKSLMDDVIMGYEANGASAVSVLTDESFFGGHSNFLTAAKNYSTIPLLRKDFIIDAYQVYEAKAIGADSILLIAECLEEKQVFEFAKLAKSLQLEVLLEVHSADQLTKINDYIDVLGVNNRNLKTFEVDIENSIQMVSKMPKGNYAIISESGIEHPETIKQLREAGFQGFLIGTYFMRNEDPALAFEQFLATI